MGGYICWLIGFWRFVDWPHCQAYTFRHRPLRSVTMVLEWFGFAANGPVAGSLAAAWQASIGNVASGSFFAQIQAYAMSGAAAASWLLAAVPVVVVAIPAVARMMKDGK
jgi:hypothetical protein